VTLDDTWQPGDWSLQATTELIQSATLGALRDDPDVISDALQAFVVTCVERDGTDRLHLYLGIALETACRTAHQHAPAGSFGDADGPMELIMEDADTGIRVADPDTEIADDPDGDPAEGRGVLAAMRYFAACANDDHDTAKAIFLGVLPNEDTFCPFVGTVLCYVGGIFADIVRAQRGDPVSVRRPEPSAAPRHDPKSGLTFADLPKDPRDGGPDSLAVTAPHGDALYCVSIYRHGTPGHRDGVVRAAIDAAVTGADLTPGTVLCGVPHAEDVEPGQVIHSGRRHLRRALRDAARQHGGTWQAVRVWQHYGTCPDTTRQPGSGDVPLFDLPGGDR
jgi:hypothetical protein